MPSDSNGNYSLPDGYLAETGQTILASQHNPPLEDLAESMTQRVMASGAKPMTGPLKASDGTASAPSLTFNSGQTTGLYKTANGLGFAVGGVQVAELISGGFKKGGKFIGEVFDWTGTTAPALCVLPYGQTLSRTTYADLWAFAQTEIAAGNAFYNNGNGSTTFGIGDLRGRVRAGKDNMGGAAASRMGATYFGADATVIGNVGGLETNNVILTHNHAITDPGHTHTGTVDGGGVATGSIAARGTTAVQAIPVNLNSNTTGITINNAGSASAHNIVQPTIILNCALFAGA